MNSNPRILITGATGFVGKTLVPYLYKNGLTKLSLLVRSVKKAEDLFQNQELSLIPIDENMEEAIQKLNPEYVIHLAAYFSGKSDYETAKKLIDSNILFTTRLLIALQNTGCKAFINTGTFTEFVHGNGNYHPNNFYSATKHATRSIIRLFQLQQGWKWINVVVYSPYGRINKSVPKVIDHLLASLDSETPVPFSGGLQKLDLVHVDDMSSFYLALIKKLPSLHQDFYEFHLGSGEAISIMEVAKTMEKVFGKEPNARWGVYPYRENESMFTVAPISNNISLLDWSPQIPLSQGLEILKADILKNLK